MSCDGCSFPYTLCQCEADAERERLKREQASFCIHHGVHHCPDHAADDVAREVADMSPDEPECRAAKHGPRNSVCTCEDSRDE